MTSPKTTLWGGLAAAALAVAAATAQSDPVLAKWAGLAGAVALALKSYFTKDDDSGPTGTSPVVLLLCAGVLLGTGCAGLAPGADAVEVRAEQTVATAFNTFDAFLTLEHTNRELVKAKAPQVHTFAEWLREPVADNGQMVPRGRSLIQSANRVRLAYKASRTPDHQATLQAALAALARAANETATQMQALQPLTR